MNFFQLGLSFSGFSVPLITELFILIDWGIYSIACAALQGFFEILQVSYELFGSSSSEGWEKAHAIMKRIMALGGVYALFRVGIMMINYLIDPSKLSDAQKTGTKIIKNIFIAAVLLLSSSFIFQKLGEFQRLVFESNLIENIIYGENGEANKKTIKEKAKSFTNKTWQLFFTRIEGKNDDECNKNYALVSQGQAEIRVLIGCHYKYYDYFPIAPFIVGILLIYYFVVYSIELGSRMIKLLVLEIISPIPIIMSIDPSSKNNLNNFVKTYIPIYLQVFLRVITLYMALALCNIVLGELKSSVSSGTLLFEINDLSFFLKIIVIIGIFQGAKELPKLVQEALGFKFGSGPGNFSGALKGIIGGTAGFIGGTVAGAFSGGVGGAVAGGLSGAINGTKDGAASKNFGGIIKSTVANYGKSRNLGRSIRNADGLLGYAGGMINSKTGYKGRVDRAVDDAQRRQERLDKLNNAILSEYAQSINPSTGRKVGTMEEDAGVMAAQVALNDYMAGKSGPITQAGLDTLRSNLKTAQDTYKEAAYNNFVSSKASDTGNGLEFFDSGGKKINPKSNYTDLSESQRALYDLQRFKQTGGLDVSSGNMYTTFTAESKKAKQEVKERQKKQGSLSYQHVEEVNKNGK